MTSADRYREAGVDLDAAGDAKRRIILAIGRARSSLAVGDLGAFGGMVRVPRDVREPVLVMSTDGVGTKVLVAVRAGVHDTVGEDLVNHSVNDILVHGARPLAFLDYIAAAEIVPDTVAQLVEGVARGCRAHEMTLAGGETAAMPDVYGAGHYDLAGTIVGVVEESEAIHGDRVSPGDVLVGFESSGLHTNGYSLARRVIFDDLGLEVDDVVPDLGATVGEVLLTVHRSYAQALQPVLGHVHGLAHITGGGIPGNLSRTLPDGCRADIDASTWDPLPVFRFLEEAGHIGRREMYEVFNMGIGMIAIVARESLEPVRASAAGAGIATHAIGEIVAGEGVHIG